MTRILSALRRAAPLLVAVVALVAGASWSS
jgi:hypothetical protein